MTAFLIWVPEPERRSPEPNSIFISRSFPEVSESKNRPDDLFLFHCMKDKFYNKNFCVPHGRWIPKNKNYPTFLPIFHYVTGLTIFAVPSEMHFSFISSASCCPILFGSRYVQYSEPPQIHSSIFIHPLFPILTFHI